MFVHGFAGSAAQFESQAMRFTSNGYPAEWIGAVDYDSLFATAPREQVWVAIDAEIDRILAATGADRVDLAGHSLGTSVLQGYLTSTPERAARVAHYVNIDGFPGRGPARRASRRWRSGAWATTRRHPGRREPPRPHAEPRPGGDVRRDVRGDVPVPHGPGAAHDRHRPRAARTGADLGPGHDLPVEQSARPAPRSSCGGSTRPPVTGSPTTPEASQVLPDDGSFGPFRVNGRATYELALTRGSGTSHHFYASPFLRSSHLVRLLTSEPGTGIDLLRETSDHHSSISLVRNKEIWGDQGAAGDRLVVGGHELATPAIAPQSKRAIGMFAFDAGVDGVTDLSAPLPALFALPFITGGDVFLPATTPPDGTIRVETVQRGRAPASPRCVNIPNWASSTDHVSVMLRDFSQQDDTFPWRP